MHIGRNMQVLPPCGNAITELGLTFMPRVRNQIRSLDQAGQSMVEFSLVILFIFILFVSVLQMILLMHAYNTIADAAKEGVRYAIVHGTGNVAGVNSSTLGGVKLDGCSGPGNPISSPAITCPDGSPYASVQQAVVDFAAVSLQNITASEVSVCYDPASDGTCSKGANTNSTWGAACSAPGCMVRVTVSHTYAAFLPWLKFHLDAAANGRIIN